MNHQKSKLIMTAISLVAAFAVVGLATFAWFTLSTNPEIKVFLSAHNGLALGINNYFTGIGSPVTDYADMGVFCVNGNEEIGKLIADNTPFRGMVLTGGVQDTCNEIMGVVTGLYDGSMASGTVTNATTLFVNEDTVEEYLSTGNVVSVTEDDF